MQAPQRAADTVARNVGLSVGHGHAMGAAVAFTPYPSKIAAFIANRFGFDDIGFAKPGFLEDHVRPTAPLAPPDLDQIVDGSVEPASVIGAALDLIQQLEPSETDHDAA